ncbi:MAG: HEAT repeat domain-containing protein [Cyanobacteria bacterium P01_G01_bin.38]
MMLEAAALFLGGWALELGKQRVGETLLQGVDNRLTPSTLEKSLAEATEAANRAVPKLFAPFHQDGFGGVKRFLSSFFKCRALPELRKPLNDKGKPDAALLTKALLKEAETHSDLKQLKADGVEPWMQIFVETYFQETNAALQFQVIQAEYYKQLRGRIGKVIFSGMAVDGTVVDEPGDLARIFVMPDVERQDQKQLALLDAIPLEVATDGQKRVLWEQQQQVRLLKDKPTQQSISAEKLFESESKRRVVILGAPGAGKTTLINYLVVTAAARHFAQNSSEAHTLAGLGSYFPILIRIRDLARYPELSVLDFLKQFVETDLNLDAIPTGFFEHWLKTGQALILLDGLDEVADNAQRRKVVEKIETFLSTCDGCPAIITSRPAGYRDDYFSRDDYPHYELLPFDDDKIETFITHWYDSRVDLESERERRKASLRKALDAKPRIKRLARNPLLLTIIALIHRYKANLPKQRHELYNSAVETLISTWDEDKELTMRPVLKYLDIRDIRRLMKQLAYWIHTQGSVEDAENGTQIDRDMLIRQLGKFIKEIKASENLQLYQAKEEATAFLDQIIKDRAGLLSQQGQNRYAFVHKTFQEYLCAQEILYLQEDQDIDDDDYIPHVKNHIRAHLHDPHWQEVLLLLIAQQAPSPAKASLRTILNAKSDYEQWLHRDLLFSGSCLAENAEINDQGTIDQILTELVNLEACQLPIVSKEIRKRVFKVISSFQDTPFASISMELLAQHQETIDFWRLIDYQSELASDEAARTLLPLLKDADLDVRSRAADALRNLGNASDIVVTGLLTLLKDTDSDVRSRGADAFRNLGNASDAVVFALLDLLKDADSDVRSRAAVALRNLGNASDIVITGLLTLLKDADSDVRSRAADALRNLGNASDALVFTLLDLLKDADSDVRSNAALALGNLGNASDAVGFALLDLLKDADSDVRSNAAYALGNLGNASDIVITGLLTLLKDADSDVRSRAALALGNLGDASNNIVFALLTLLKDEDSNVRAQAARSFRSLEISDNAAADIIITNLLLLLEDENFGVRSDVLYTLRKLNHQSSEMLLTLMRAFEKLLLDHEEPANYEELMGQITVPIFYRFRDELIQTFRGVIKSGMFHQALLGGRFNQ